MNDFGYSQLPARVIFGFGTIARIPDEARTLGCRRVLVLRDPHHANNAPRQVCLTSRLPLAQLLRSCSLHGQRLRMSEVN
jgi:alcohol dehydrogenase class IV